MQKTSTGRFFEDFSLGQIIKHATPRTVSEGDVALYQSLTGSRFAQQCALSVAQANGLSRLPLDDLLSFHVVFGKTVPDISINAVANLGYADGRFLALTYPGDTLRAESEVTGLKENSNGKSGIVWVRSSGYNQDDQLILQYCRWVMVRKRDPSTPAPATTVPDLPAAVDPANLVIPKDLGALSIDQEQTGSPWFFEDFEVGEKIDHVDGMGVTASEHRLATRLYQNTAKVHFDDHRESSGRLGACIVYGGVVISLARALSFNGLGNLLHILAINAGAHANPCVAGDTVYAWSEVLDKADLRDDAGALRLRLVATKNHPAEDFPMRDEQGKYRPEVLLDFDYWGLMPKRGD